MVLRAPEIQWLQVKVSLLLQQAGKDGEQFEVWEAATRLGNFLETVAPPVLHGSQLEHQDAPQRRKHMFPAIPQRRPAEAFTQHSFLLILSAVHDD